MRRRKFTDKAVDVPVVTQGQGKTEDSGDVSGVVYRWVGSRSCDHAATSSTSSGVQKTVLTHS